MADFLSSKPDIGNIITDPEVTKKTLVEKLDSLPHTHRMGMLLPDFAGYHDYYEDPPGIIELAPSQLIRVNYLLDSLDDPAFIQRIARLLTDAVEDKQREHGGLILFQEDGRLYPQPFQNELLNHTSFEFPAEALENPFFAQYHFHALEDDSTPYAGPSQSRFLFFNGGERVLEGSDMATCEVEILQHGESHNLVITKLEGKKFNIDYYGGVRNVTHPGTIRPKITVIDLGNYDFSSAN